MLAEEIERLLKAVPSPPCGMETSVAVLLPVHSTLRSEPTVWDGDDTVPSSPTSTAEGSEPTVWDGDSGGNMGKVKIGLVPSPPCGMETT